MAYLGTFAAGRRPRYDGPTASHLRHEPHRHLPPHASRRRVGRFAGSGPAGVRNSAPAGLGPGWARLAANQRHCYAARPGRASGQARRPVTRGPVASDWGTWWPARAMAALAMTARRSRTSTTTRRCSRDAVAVDVDAALPVTW